MDEHSTEDELVALEHEWAQAVLENDMDKLELILAQDYTLAANNFPGGLTRLSRQKWMATVPVYDVHSYELRDIVVHLYGDVAVVLANLGLQAGVQGEDRSGSSTLSAAFQRLRLSPHRFTESLKTFPPFVRVGAYEHRSLLARNMLIEEGKVSGCCRLVETQRQIPEFV